MVMIIVGILSAVAIPQFIDFSDDAKKAVTQKKLSELKIALIGDPQLVQNGYFLKPGFIVHIGSPPNSLDDLITQGSYTNYSPITQSGWNGPYIDSTESNWNKDGWGTVIDYNKANRTITSCGADKVCGNTDDITIHF